MVRGAPWPEIYDWTWGELSDFISARDEARKEHLRDQAVMMFRQASLISSMLVAEKGTKYNVMDEFPFLWSDEERREARVAELKNKLEKKSKKSIDS